MILGTETRTRQQLDVLAKLVEHHVGELPAQPAEHRDRGHFLTPRLYPTAPFDPWLPASEYAPDWAKPQPGVLVSEAM